MIVVAGRQLLLLVLVACWWLLLVLCGLVVLVAGWQLLLAVLAARLHFLVGSMAPARLVFGLASPSLEVGPWDGSA